MMQDDFLIHSYDPDKKHKLLEGKDHSVIYLPSCSGHGFIFVMQSFNDTY